MTEINLDATLKMGIPSENHFTGSGCIDAKKLENTIPAGHTKKPKNTVPRWSVSQFAKNTVPIGQKRDRHPGRFRPADPTRGDEAEEACGGVCEGEYKPGRAAE